MAGWMSRRRTRPCSCSPPNNRYRQQCRVSTEDIADGPAQGRGNGLLARAGLACRQREGFIQAGEFPVDLLVLNMARRDAMPLRVQHDGRADRHAA